MVQDKCTRCRSKPPLEGKVRCQKCTKSDKMRYRRLKDQGMCTRCAKVKAFGDYAHCLSCIKAASMKRIRSSI